MISYNDTGHERQYVFVTKDAKRQEPDIIAIGPLAYKEKEGAMTSALRDPRLAVPLLSDVYRFYVAQKPKS